MAKKIIGLVVALTMVFSLALCTASASAYQFGDITKGLFSKTFTGRVIDALVNGCDDKAAADDTASDAVVEEEETTKFKPLFDFYIDYDVVKTLNYGFEFGNVPEKEEPTITEPITDETPAVDTTEEVVTDVIVEQEPVEITEETPLADVEQIANTGDAGVATIVALSAVSAAAFVVAKKK